MEAIIRTNDRNAFNSLIRFLRSFNFEIETKEEKRKKTENNITINIPSYSCGGKVSDFNREDLYGSRL